MAILVVDEVHLDNGCVADTGSRIRYIWIHRI